MPDTTFSKDQTKLILELASGSDSFLDDESLTEPPKDEAATEILQPTRESRASAKQLSSSAKKAYGYESDHVLNLDLDEAFGVGGSRPGTEPPAMEPGAVRVSLNRRERVESTRALQMVETAINAKSLRGAVGIRPAPQEQTNITLQGEEAPEDTNHQHRVEPIASAVLVGGHTDTNIPMVTAMPSDDKNFYGNRKRYYLLVLLLLLTLVAGVVAIAVSIAGGREGEPQSTPSPAPMVPIMPSAPNGETLAIPPSLPITESPSDDPGPAHSLTGTAYSSRYWDCSGGACGCGHLEPHGDPGIPTYCHANGLFVAPPENEHGAVYYGTTAVSVALGGDWWLPESCGRCWKLTANSNVGENNHETTIVVKGTNFCPDTECSAEPEFRIAAPGFHSTPESAWTVCENRDPTETPEAFKSCFDWMTGNAIDPNQGCQCDLFQDPVLREGCENFLSLGWDDPEVKYEELSECPEELGRLPCWEENGFNWPYLGIPELCANPYP